MKLSSFSVRDLVNHLLPCDDINHFADAYKNMCGQSLDFFYRDILNLHFHPI